MKMKATAVSVKDGAKEIVKEMAAGAVVGLSIAVVVVPFAIGARLIANALNK